MQGIATCIAYLFGEHFAVQLTGVYTTESSLGLLAMVTMMVRTTLLAKKFKIISIMYFYSNFEFQFS